MHTAAVEQTQASWSQSLKQCRGWLKVGIRDFQTSPFLALSYGFGFFFISYAVILGLWFTGLAWMLLPAFAGAILVGPLLAIGLYQEARRIQDNTKQSVASVGQLVVVGAILMTLLLMWFRSATLLYAIFFGLKPFPGFVQTLQTLLFSPEGLTLLVVGTAVGGLFAALTLAVSFFSVPMLADREIDGFSAMGKSFAACGNNFKLATTWGVIVTIGVAASFASGLLAMIVIFPLLGFATWHAYVDVMGND